MATTNFLLNKIEKPLIHRLNYSKFSKQIELRNCYAILGIPDNSDQEEIRKAYLNLVKKYHPDSGTAEVSAQKFSEIDEAFKTLIDKKSKERWNVEEPETEEDIKHTAPQHRQYLNFDGLGVGTPFQRQKHYTQIRAMQAAENVLNHRISKASAEEGSLLPKTPLKHKTKTKYGFDRLVEDLIQEAMSKGEFSNLSGVGKPLPSHESRNPYVDFVTHKLNEVLIDNGFTPEWITLQKEIREDVQKLRESLLVETSGKEDWIEVLSTFESQVEGINRKIDKFNLVVPILNKQMIRVSLKKEGERAMVGGRRGESESRGEEKNGGGRRQEEAGNVFGFIENLFGK